MQVRWKILEGDTGTALVAVTDDRICWLGFADKGVKYLKQRFLADWGHAELEEKSHPLMQRALKKNPPVLPLLLEGTPFQVKVWQELLKIPRGTVIPYGELANRIGKPKSARAVGNAVGANPVSWLVPCHRVSHANGSLAGFGWGESCKRRLLSLEGYAANTSRME
jgi:AraC family transcriptional regulator of adaptative response/methylated-DNA-[protein]-cysteine methyltransferase